MQYVCMYTLSLNKKNQLLTSEMNKNHVSDSDCYGFFVCLKFIETKKVLLNVFEKVEFKCLKKIIYEYKTSQN